MVPILVAFGSALVFGLFAFGTYGTEGMAGYAWIRMVLAALVVSGLLVVLVNRRLPCWVCQLSQRPRFRERWCDAC